MFGYVRVYKDELKIKDYDTYKSYYCGICKLIGKRHNHLARLALNYDFTFLALMCDSLCTDIPEFSMEGCLKKLGKKKIIKRAAGMDFAADMNILFAYYKLSDDIRDRKSIKAFAKRLPFVLPVRKLKRKYPQITKTVSDRLKRLNFLEEDNCSIPDKVANEFAEILRGMFEYYEPSLGAFGYNLGRLIYIMDACDDMMDDYENGLYNPIVSGYDFQGEYNDELKERITVLLYNSLSLLAEEYEKLKIQKNKPVLDNIIYLGIRARCDQITKGKWNNEGSL